MVVRKRGRMPEEPAGLEKLFQDGLLSADIPPMGGSFDWTDRDGRYTMHVTLRVPDVADWALRYRVLEVVRQFEADHDEVVVHCYFRSQAEQSVAL
jgi:hypothetical protein